MTSQRPPHLQLVVTNGREVPEACHHVVRQYRPLAGLGLDPIERLALACLRHLCASFASGTTAGWERAHDTAEAALGLGDGPAFVALLTALLRGMRTERPNRFSYMAADCPTCSQRVTPDELLIVRLRRAARSDGAQQLDQLARALAQRSEAPRIAAAARALGNRLAAFARGVELQGAVHAGASAMVAVGATADGADASRQTSEEGEHGT